MQFSILLFLLFINIGFVYCNKKLTKSCQHFFKTNPEPFTAKFMKNGVRESLYTYVNLSYKYELNNIVELNPIGVISVSDHYISVCVSFVTSVSHTSASGTLNDLAFVKIVYNPDVATSIVRVETSCWNRTKSMSACNPVFMPMPDVMASSTFLYSPMMKPFWERFQDENLFHRNWIRRITIRTYKDSYPSGWVSLLRVSNITELGINGNDWVRPERLLAHFPNLETIDLSNNRIEVLPRDVFRELPALKRVFLGSNSLTQFPQELCSTTVLQMSDQIGYRSFRIQDSDITHLKKIEDLRLDSTMLHSNVDKLFRLRHLRYLYLSGCSIDEIIDDNRKSSNKTSEIIHLDLSHNQLIYLPENIFSRLQLLKYLYMDYNSFEYCPANSLKALPDLERLKLSHNRIKDIFKDCFLEIRKVKYIDVSWNNIHSIDKDAFKNLEILEYLDLSNNKLYVIHKDTFSEVYKLDKLNISFNKLVEEPILGKLNMTYVDLSHNNLKYLTSMTNHVKNIIFVDLSWNSISELRFDKIDELDLSYNALPYISEDMWKELEKLKNLNLGGINFECCNNNTLLLKQKLTSLNVVLRNFDSRDTIFCFEINEKGSIVYKRIKEDPSICGIGVKLAASVGILYVCFINMIM